MRPLHVYAAIGAAALLTAAFIDGVVRPAESIAVPIDASDPPGAADDQHGTAALPAQTETAPADGGIAVPPEQRGCFPDEFVSPATAFPSPSADAATGEASP